MKILLIDDNARLTQIYQMIISKQGHEAVIELDSSIAFQSAKRLRPDLILLDLMMEPLSGWDILEQIRSDPDLSDLMVIVLTGKIMTVKEAIRYGMEIDGFIMKPLERSMLVAAIEESWEIMIECEMRYKKAIDAGLSEEEASNCRKMIRKRKMLANLKDILLKQERILNVKLDEYPEVTQNLYGLRSLIESLHIEFVKQEAICP